MRYLDAPHSLRFLVTCMLSMVALAANSLDAAKPNKSSPYLLQEYWPVFMEPPSGKASGFPVIDMLVDGKGKAFETVSLLPVRDDEKVILGNTAMSLKFAPGSVAGEGNPGFYRHPVLAYFVLDEADRERVTVAPLTKFRMPPSVVQAIAPAMAGSPAKSVTFTVALRANGKIQSITGTTKVEKLLVSQILSKLKKNMSFKPAEVDGEPVPVQLQLHIHKQGGQLIKAVKEAFDVRKGNQPAPLRPVDGSFQLGKQHSVLLSIFNDGRVFDIQCLDRMTDSEVLQAGIAFRNWRFNSMGGRPQFRRAIVTYTYSVDDGKAEILDVGMQDFPTAPRPVKRPSPVYPQALRKAGTSGTVLLLFIIDERGNVRSVEVRKSDHPAFSAAAAAAVYQWKFEPATIEGMAVKSRVRLPIPFKFNR